MRLASFQRDGKEGRKEKGWEKEEGENSGGIKETGFASSKKVGWGWGRWECVYRNVSEWLSASEPFP